MHAGDVAAGPIEIRDQSATWTGSEPDREHDRNLRGGSLGGQRGWRRSSNDRVDSDRSTNSIASAGNRS